MRAVIQRVSEASVAIDGTTVGAIQKGFLVLLGITHEDSQEDVDYLVRKIKNLRVFEDEAGKMNQSIEAIEGAILSISQFTLYGETKKETVQALFKLPDLKWLHHCTKLSMRVCTLQVSKWLRVALAQTCKCH